MKEFDIDAATISSIAGGCMYIYGQIKLQTLLMPSSAVKSDNLTLPSADTAVQSPSDTVCDSLATPRTNHDLEQIDELKLSTDKLRAALNAGCGLLAD